MRLSSLAVCSDVRTDNPEIEQSFYIEEAFAAESAAGRALSLVEAAAEALTWLAMVQRDAIGPRGDAYPNTRVP
jgi:hypothetical protein